MNIYIVEERELLRKMNKLDRLLQLQGWRFDEQVIIYPDELYELESLYSEIQQAMEIEKIMNYYIGDIEINENPKKKIERICKELIEIREQNNGLDYTCENMESQIKQLQEERNEIKSFYEDLLDQWKEQTKNYAKLKEKSEEYQRIVERLKQRIDELQEFVDGCEEAKNMPNSMMSPIAGLMEQSELKELKTILGEDNLGKHQKTYPKRR